MVIVVGLVLGAAVSMGGVFAYSMAAVASMSDADMQALQISPVATSDLNAVRVIQD